MQLVTEAA